MYHRQHYIAIEVHVKNHFLSPSTSKNNQKRAHSPLCHFIEHLAGAGYLRCRRCHPRRRCASRSSRRREEGRQNSYAATPFARSRLLHRLLGWVLDGGRAGGSLALLARTVRRRWRYLRTTIVRQRSRRHEEDARRIARGGGATRVWHRLRRHTRFGGGDRVGRGWRRPGVPVHRRNSAGDRAQRSWRQGRGRGRAGAGDFSNGWGRGRGCVLCHALQSAHQIWGVG